MEWIKCICFLGIRRGISTKADIIPVSIGEAYWEGEIDWEIWSKINFRRWINVLHIGILYLLNENFSYIFLPLTNQAILIQDTPRFCQWDSLKSDLSVESSK